MFLPIRASFHTILCLEQDVPSTGWILCIFRIPCKKKKKDSTNQHSTLFLDRNNNKNRKKSAYTKLQGWRWPNTFVKAPRHFYFCILMPAFFNHMHTEVCGSNMLFVLLTGTWCSICCPHHTKGQRDKNTEESSDWARIKPGTTGPLLTAGPLSHTRLWRCQRLPVPVSVSEWHQAVNVWVRTFLPLCPKLCNLLASVDQCRSPEKYRESN